jgi:hypothetical protein
VAQPGFAKIHYNSADSVVVDILKIGTVYTKIGTVPVKNGIVHLKFGEKIRIGQVQFSSTRRIFKHWLHSGRTVDRVAGTSVGVSVTTEVRLTFMG